MTNDFPEFTGRVCPALCEKGCVLNKTHEPVTIRENEAAITEIAFNEGMVVPRIPKHRNGKKVAVIGSGPSGLACATRLNQYGYDVTVYEKDEIKYYYGPETSLRLIKTEPNYFKDIPVVEFMENKYRGKSKGK